MTSARTLLDRGLARLGEHFFESFTVDGAEAIPLKGLIETTTVSNTIEQGGFLPEAGGVLAVPVGEFAKIKLTPYPGMRVTVRGREFIASSVENRYNQWGLILEIAHPKVSDLPSFVKVIGTSGESVPIEFQVGEISIT